MSNIVKGKFGKRGGGEKESGGQNAKLTFTQLAEMVSLTIARRHQMFAVPWEGEFHIIEPSPGGRLILEELEGKVMREMPLDYLANRIVEWLLRQKMPEVVLSYRRAKEVIEMWRAIMTPIPMADIKPVAWLDEPCYTWHRLPWAKDASNGLPMPSWESLLARMTNSKSFMAWIGSLFFEQSSLHGYLWLHGKGGDGKGSINRFLKRVFGRAYRSKQPPGPHDRFWTYDLIGARLVVFPDCEDSRFVARGLFKSLTGGDPISVEAKGQMAFTTLLTAKYLVLSNEKPSISSEVADMRRIIYCELEKGPYDPGYEDRLWEEGGTFLAACIAVYAQAYADHRPIIAETDQISDWVSTVEEPMEVVFDKWFVLDPEGRVVPAEMQAILREEWRHRPQQLEFLNWLERTHKVKKRGQRDGDTVFYRYRGISKRKTVFDTAMVDFG